MKNRSISVPVLNTLLKLSSPRKLLFNDNTFIYLRHKLSLEFKVPYNAMHTELGNVFPVVFFLPINLSISFWDEK